MKSFRCLYLIPGIDEPQVVTLVEEDGMLPLLQSLIGGVVDCVGFLPEFDLWCHDESRILNLTMNKFNLAGPVVVTRNNDEGDTLPLDDLDIHRLRELIRRCR